VSKKCSGNRVIWHKGTPSKNPGDRSIRRLTRWEKHTLFEGRPDLDPSKGGGFDMGKWMNGEEQEEDPYGDDDDEDMLVSESESEDENDEPMNVSNVSSNDSFHDALEAEDERVEKENSGDSSFLMRLMQVGK
jgi:hypothetical protein